MDELLRQLANPNLHDIPRNLLFRVEMWDCNEAMFGGSSRLRQAPRSDTLRLMWRLPTILISTLRCATAYLSSDSIRV